MADLAIGDVAPSALDVLYLNYRSFCARLGCPAASFDRWLLMERRGFGGRLGSLSLSRQEHESQRAAYRAKLDSETASALQSYSL